MGTKRPTRGRANLDRLGQMPEEEIERTSPPELQNLPADFWKDGVVRKQVAAPAEGDATSHRVDEESAGRRTEAIESLIRLSKTSRPVAAPHRTTRDERGKRNWKRDDLYD